MLGGGKALNQERGFLSLDQIGLRGRVGGRREEGGGRATLKFASNCSVSNSRANTENL